MNTIKNVFFALIALLTGSFFYFDGFNLFSPSAPMAYPEAVSELNEMLEEVSWAERPVRRRAKLSLDGKKDLQDTLPDIKEYPLVVNYPRNDKYAIAEIFVTTTRSKSGSDGHMVEVGKAFNKANIRLDGGMIAKIRIRQIASGTGYQFIAAKKYLPDAFSPVHHLWIEMAKAKGIKMTPIRESMARSVGGVVMKKTFAGQIRKNYGRVDIKSIINEVVQGNLAMGYTVPFSSSTGLNFLLSVLDTFAEGKQDQLLSPAVVSTFEQFQRGVPFVALTTLHMRDSVKREGGSLDAFVMGHQTFLKTAELQSGYEFIPFGVSHNHPLYGVGDLSAEKKEVLEKFAQFSEQPRYKKLALDYGWNQPISRAFKPTVKIPAGHTLIQAQQLWKEKKNSGHKIAALFLADISGSMDGVRIKKLKKALLVGSDFISPENSIGLAVFHNRVDVILPIKKFNFSHKSAYHAAVQDIQVSGNTAMYDGILVALSMLVKEKQKNPDIKPMLFVLSDGETNKGYLYDDVARVIEGIRIPVYTIGYEANLKEMKRLSSLVEAASINAGEGNVEYKIGSLLNAQM
ncbi:vWA domain-containing protein [Magnetococcales bacterium HHB-1]